MVIFAGACEVALSLLIKRTRKLFPAVVSGVVIIAVGLELGRIGANVPLEHAAARRAQSARSIWFLVTVLQPRCPASDCCRDPLRLSEPYA
jgi:xanthine/uracil permease